MSRPGSLLSVRGLTELVRDTSAMFYEGLDRIEVLDPAGIRRIAFGVDDLEGTVAGLRERGVELVGEVVQFEDAYRLCYVRGPEGIIVMLTEALG